MIFDTHTLKFPLELSADLCVVGTGAGGAMVARIAAEAGLSVVALEAGEYLVPRDMTQREEEMFPRLFWESAGRTTADRAVKIHQGRGVGGSTLHNLNLCKRIPSSILERWVKDRGLTHLPAPAWQRLYEEVESLLGVAPVPEEEWSRHNQLLEAGVKALGWKGGGLWHNRRGCLGAGFCELGCSYDAKNNAVKVLVPRAIAAGAEILPLCQAVRVEHARGRATAVVAAAIDPVTRRPRGEVRVRARQICLSASATGSAALLLRSRVPDPGGETGRTLRIHPGVVAAGDFEAEVCAWEGIPQAYECTEFLDLDQEEGHRAWILPAFAHPVGTATMVPGHAGAHAQLMRRYAHLAVFTAMIHDRTRGSVSPDGDFAIRLDYWPNEEDRRELVLGLWGSAALLQAAGAKQVVIPTRRPVVFERGDSLEVVKELEIARGLLDIVAVHPMGTVPMGDDPQVAAVSSEGRHHHLEGLWIADGSLFPSSIGVPPQLSVYAMGLHVGRAIVRAR